MKSMSKGLKVWIAALAAMLGVLVGTPAHADTVELKDGRKLEGRVEREVDGAILFVMKVGAIEHSQWITADQIVKLERTEAAAAAPRAADPEKVKIADGAGRVAFISLEEMVGPFFNRDALMKSVEILDKLPSDQRPDVIVLWIDSGGGALLELFKLTETIQNEIKPKYRTVAWIRSAISAAAMTAWACEEIYMMDEGNIGACTGYMTVGGRTQAMDGAGLEQVLEYMERVSEWGRHEPLVMRAMQISGEKRKNKPLSADISPDGRVTWYENDKGQYLVCDKDKILTLNAADSVKFGVARGIANTKDELAKLLGFQEWVEVGPEADRYQQEFRRNVQTAQTRSNELMSKIQIALNFAGSAPTNRERDTQIARARTFLRELKSLIDRAPSLKTYSQFTPEWFQDVDDQLRKMANPRGY